MALADDSAELWIGLLVPAEEREGHADVAIYCPHCAEGLFQFFSERRRRRTG